MKKFKVFTNMDAEEKFLNDKARQGHVFKKYSAFGRYHFIDEAPQNLNYRVDYRFFKNQKDLDNYLALFEDAGWQHVWGTTNSGGQYFLPERVDANAEIFSDRESAAARYKALYNICYVNMIWPLGYIVVLLMTNHFDFLSIGFLTPGLWGKTGVAFWQAFLFELPFVAFRSIFPLFFIVFAAIYAYWGTKAYREYKRQIG